jgi:ankyrin repeat protein
MRRALLLAGAAVLVWCGRGGAQVIDPMSFYTVAMAAAHDKTEDVILLLQKGSLPTGTDNKGETALGYAAQFSDVRMAQALLYYKAPVDARDQFGNTPLHWAALRGSMAVMQLLLDAKATIDAPNQQGVTPLMMAANGGQVQAVRLLLKSGADPHRGDFTGRDAIGWADGKPAVLQFLRAAK